jgi:type I restriction enzyme S subunit
MNNRKVKINQIAYLNLKTYSKKDLPEEVEYLDTGNLTRNVISELQKYSIVDANLPSRAQRKAKKNTILYSTVRPNLEHYGFLENPPYNLIVSTGFTTIDTFDDTIDPKYLYYAITQKHLTNYLHTIATNNVSSYPSINPDDLGNLVLSVPENLLEQQRIASVLSSLDAKIELNNKINRELEAVAKTLYDYWFVQFNFPDKNGKPYKTSGGKMVWNEQLKREIPEGWEAGILSDIANITMGQSPSGESYNESKEGMFFFQGCTDFGERFPSIRQYTTAPTRFAKPSDILLSVRAPVGTLNIANVDCCIGRGLAALNSKHNCISYLYEVMKSFKQIFDRRNVDGTTFGSITKDDLFSLKIIKPEKNIVEKYEKIMNSFFQKLNDVEKENLQLSSLRDWLLPMLMNGQVTVHVAEERISMVAEQEVGYGE